jgi:hypothetical protein
MKPIVTALILMMAAASIGIHPATVSATAGNAYPNELQITFEPVQQVYKPGEPIRFRVQGDRPYHLYLFSVDQDRNEGYIILPNAKQTYNRYEAGRVYDVPEKHVEFFSDRPGTEKIIMLASTRELKVPMDHFNAAGDFYTGSAGSVDQAVKALRVRSRESEAEPVVRELPLIITGPDPISGDRRSDDRQPAPAPRDEVAAFVSSARTEYRPGEIVTITFGANRKGYVHLFTVAPDGHKTFLKKQEVDGTRFYQVRGEAMLPAGEHQLVAIYDKDANLEKEAVDALGLGERRKDIRLIEDRPEAYAVYHLTVRP